MKKITALLAVIVAAWLVGPSGGNAQEYKLRQVMDMKDTKIESTVYVKGKRQRVESVMPGMGVTIAVIEQCDLKRTIKLNDKRKLYYIDLWSTGGVEPLQPRKEVVAAGQKKEVKKGGTITIWSSIRDTGERKKMFGFTARHLWTSQKMKPSADACSMKDSMLRKTDGWYIDLAQFECRRDYRYVPYGDGGDGGADCVDKMVTHTSGKGKLGFPLFEKTTMIMGGTTMETNLETLELSTAKLDTMLFTIPPGYRAVNNESELYDLKDMADLMRNAQAGKDNGAVAVNREQKAPGKIRIGVYAPAGNPELQAGTLQQHLVGEINGQGVEAIAVGNEAEARQYHCDYTLSPVFTSIKQESTVGGVIKAIRKRDPTLTGAYSIQGSMILLSLSDGKERSRQAMDGKYDGKIDEAASRALDEALPRVMKALN